MKIKNIKKSITALVLGGIILSNSAVAMAAKKNIGGGILYYGVTFTECYSNYYHSTKTHMSTAVNGKGYMKKSYWINSRYTSYASIDRTLTGNASYYDTK
ncbi:lactococcin 972 family bacteriocin [Clostridium sp. D53t1_180928_C8]|uniref:lactococcin 972 family bacteriocin n=1 Tax=Clostridium sp. D53t1_180928_C8 TaxID=2787101 RepID=UPI0018AA2C32|nr:lactococcin 972 family bacteriocin [Clostridium sp. D53t1_180928_C8]